MQLGPEPVELGGLGLVEHQPAQVVVLAVKEGQRDDLIDGHDLGVAKRGRERPGGSRRTPLRTAAAPPSRRERRSAARARLRLADLGPAGEQLQLHAPLPSGRRVESAAGHELTALDQVGRQPNLQHLGRLHAEARGVDRRAAGVLAKERGVETDRGPFGIRRLPLAGLALRPSSRTALDERSAQR